MSRNKALFEGRAVFQRAQPTDEMCRAEHDHLVCTMIKGHDDDGYPHIADYGDDGCYVILAIWKVVEGEEVALE